MNRRATLAMATTGLLCLAVGLSASDTFAQQKSLKEQLVGTWTLVSSDQVRPDGTALFSPSLPSPARSAAPNVRIHRLTVNTKSGFGPDARLPQMSGIALRLKGRASALGPCRQCGARIKRASSVGPSVSPQTDDTPSTNVEFFEVSRLESMPIHPSFAWVRAGVCRCGLSRLMRKYGTVAGLGRWHAAGRAEPSADRCGLSGGP
jgi:hypothetical protein